MKWIEIILYILELILTGMERTEAVGKASALFDIDINDIWDHFE